MPGIVLSTALRTAVRGLEDACYQYPPALQYLVFLLLYNSESFPITYHIYLE